MTTTLVILLVAQVIIKVTAQILSVVAEKIEPTNADRAEIIRDVAEFMDKLAILIPVKKLSEKNKTAQ